MKKVPLLSKIFLLSILGQVSLGQAMMPNDEESQHAQVITVQPVDKFLLERMIASRNSAPLNESSVNMDGISHVADFFTQQIRNSSALQFSGGMGNDPLILEWALQQLEKAPQKENIVFGYIGVGADEKVRFTTCFTEASSCAPMSYGQWWQMRTEQKGPESAPFLVNDSSIERLGYGSSWLYASVQEISLHCEVRAMNIQTEEYTSFMRQVLDNVVTRIDPSKMVTIYTKSQAGEEDQFRSVMLEGIWTEYSSFAPAGGAYVPGMFDVSNALRQAGFKKQIVRSSDLSRGMHEVAPFTGHNKVPLPVYTAKEVLTWTPPFSQ